MMYFTGSLSTCRPANRKCAEIQEFVEQFTNCLFADDLSRDAFVEEIRRKVEQLNEAHPRTKRLVVIGDYRPGLSSVSCYHKGRICNYESVFTIRILPVRRTYRFAETDAALKEGGAK